MQHWPVADVGIHPDGAKKPNANSYPHSNSYSYSNTNFYSESHSLFWELSLCPKRSDWEQLGERLDKRLE